MKYGTTSKLVLGIYFFLSVCILSIKAEVSAQRRPFIRSKYDVGGGGDISPANSIQSLSLEPKILLRRAQEWTDEEEQLLLKLRSQGLSWAEIEKSFPERSWRALSQRYSTLTKNTPTSRKKPQPWTQEESDLMLELSKKDMTGRERAKFFPGRKAGEVGRRHYHVVKGYPAPREFRRLWTAEEDKLLLELGERDMSWEERVKLFNNRTLKALQLRYWKLTPSNWTKKGRFTSEEDKAILEALGSGMEVEEISEMLDRSKRGVVRRIRKLEKLNRVNLRPERVKGRQYTVAELSLIEEMVKKGMSWKDIAAEYFPERTGVSVKRAYRRYQIRKEKGE